MTVYSIKAVSRLTGLKPDTIRAWERRYGAIAPQRSEGGQRGYSASDVVRLQLLCEAIEAGQTIGRIAQLPDDELRALLPQKEPSQPVGIEGILGALVRYDAAGAERELRRLAALMPPRRLVHTIIVPLVQSLGKRWEDGELGVAQEHMGTALVRGLLDAMLGLYEPSGDRQPLLLATLPGELHELGLLCVALLAGTYGVPALLLGPQLPVDELARAARATRARVIGLSLADTPDNEAVLSALATLDAALAPEQLVWLGGASAAALPAERLPERCRVFGSLEAIEPELAAWGRALLY